MKRIFILLSVASLLSFHMAQANVVGKTEVLSTGDYGLELDWAKDSDSNIYDITTDEDNSLYNIQEGGTVVKYNAKGEKIWEKDLSSNCRFTIYSIINSKHGYLLLDVGFVPDEKTGSPYVFMYDGGSIIELTPEKKEDIYYNGFFMKINKNDGGFVDFFLNRGSSSIQITDDNSIYLHSFIDESFKGIDTIRLKSSVRTHGGYDTYIAKINPDFTLAWDFAIGGERHDVPEAPEEYYYEYWGEPAPVQSGLANWFYVKDDTLVLKASIFSDGVDIDPDPDKEILLDIIWNNDAVVAKYQLNGNEMPKLIEYYYNWTPYLANKAYIGDNGHLYSLDYPVIDEDYPLFYATNRHEYREIKSDFSTYRLDDYAHNIRSSFGAPSFGLQRIDKDGNLYVPYCPRDEDTTDVQLNDSIFLHVDDYIEIGRAIIKFDSLGSLRWAVHWPYAFWAERYTYDNVGGVYVGGTGLGTYNKADSDLDPDPNKTHIVENPWGMLMRYVETYRIKSTPSENGKIITPEKLVRWGKSAEVSVVPNAGYEVEDVKTSRGEKLARNADGKYVVENVTDVVTVSATFKKTSAVDDVYSNRVRIYPNPVDALLCMESDGRLTDAVIYNAQGMEILAVPDGSGKIDVASLPAGLYTLKANLEGMPIVKQFIKK